MVHLFICTVTLRLVTSLLVFTYSTGVRLTAKLAFGKLNKLSPTHVRSFTHTDKTHSALMCPELMNFVTFTSFFFLSSFSDVYPHMAAGCEIMSCVDNTDRLDREWNKVVGEEGKGRMEGDVKTEGLSQVFTLRCIRERNPIEIATALEQSCQAYIGPCWKPQRNMVAYYGLQMYLQGKEEISRKGSTSSWAKWQNFYLFLK